MNSGLIRDLEMTDLDDKLSFLLDDHPGENADANLDEVIADVNLQYRARRYHMIGEVMRHELPEAIDTSFHSNVMAQKIEQLAKQQIQGGVVTASTRVQPLGMRWKVERETPGLQQKLNAYLVTHTEYSNSMQSLIPQARVAGFDSQQ